MPEWNSTGCTTSRGLGQTPPERREAALHPRSIHQEHSTVWPGTCHALLRYFAFACVRPIAVGNPAAPWRPVALGWLSSTTSQGCVRRESISVVAPEAVGQAAGGVCQRGWGRLLSVTNAIEAGTCGHWLGALEGGGGGGLPMCLVPNPPSNASLPGAAEALGHPSSEAATTAHASMARDTSPSSPVASSPSAHSGLELCHLLWFMRTSGARPSWTALRGSWGAPLTRDWGSVSRREVPRGVTTAITASRPTAMRWCSPPPRGDACLGIIAIGPR